MYKLMPVLLLFISCSHYSSYKTESEKIINRSLASTATTPGKCSEILAHLATRDFTFSEKAFDDRFKILGSGYISNSLLDVSRRTNLSQEQDVMLTTLRDRIIRSETTTNAISELTVDEKYLVWNLVMRPQMLASEEIVLRGFAQEGDEGAAFLLRLPAGEMRQNAGTALNLLKRAEPETPISEIVRRLETRMSVCVR